MGLDSVELVIEIENFFSIEILDEEAERLYTIQDMVDTVAAHLNIIKTDMKLRDTMFRDVALRIRELTKTNGEIELSDLACNYIKPEEQEKWQYLSKELNLSVPKPDRVRKYGNKLSDKVISLFSMPQMYNWTDITFDQFVTAICANNYLDLIKKANITSKYEIYVAVMGITVDKIGVHYYEIGPDKSFTSDLGVD